MEQLLGMLSVWVSLTCKVGKVPFVLTHNAAEFAYLDVKIGLRDQDLRRDCQALPRREFRD